MAAIKGGDDFSPFPVKEQLPGVDFCLTSSPPLHEAIGLGFQHFLVMLGTTVMIANILVPQMGGGPEEKAKVIQTLLFVSGLNTLCQTMVGCRTSVVIGGSYAFIIPAIAIIFSEKNFKSISAFGVDVEVQDNNKSTTRGNYVRINVSGDSWCLGVVADCYELAKCVEVGLPALIILVFISQYFAQLLKPVQAIGRRHAIIITVGLAWAFAAVLTVAGAFKHSSPKTQFYCRTDRSGLFSAAPWIRFPYPFQWGRPILNIGDGIAMTAAAFVALVESTGTFIAAARFGSATPIPPSVFGRGVGWLICPLDCVDICSISAASAGLGFLQFCNLNSFRTKFILGYSLFMGLSVSQYFNEFLLVTGLTPVHTHLLAFNSMLQVIFSSPATVAGMIALFLDLTLHRRHPSTRIDSGRHWWKRFRLFDADTRSNEFYSLPWGLNKYFPSL
ncbi:hypothetical protein Cgig2_019511 [Carnegiea gigantea]|uniref:Uncharacterized protein n=1 Tax=Carnegiea gigantea TaxID=171969 RepID=A0A9Q1KQF8_9CARY|nr:hypothetical protein Cgig2_019511 [Carnegiea gigantea]